MGHCNGWERERERAGESQMRVIDLSNKRRENSKVGFVKSWNSVIAYNGSEICLIFNKIMSFLFEETTTFCPKLQHFDILNKLF